VTLAAKISGGRHSDVLVGEIHGQADAGPQLVQGRAQLPGLPAHGPGQPGHGQVEFGIGPGGDEFAHGLGLGEVEAPVQKGAFGEFPGAGRPGAGGEHGVQYGGQYRRRAMAEEFHRVLAV